MEFENPVKKQAVFVVLDDRYLTGISVVDEQHKKLVKLCNELYNAVMRERGTGSVDYTDHVKKALQECSSYAQSHFRTEEKLMTACKFSGYKEHKFRHEQFIKRVLVDSRNFDAMNLEKAMSFLNFLKEWVLSHIAHEDRLFVEPLKQYLAANKKNQPSEDTGFGIKS